MVTPLKRWEKKKNPAPCNDTSQGYSSVIHITSKQHRLNVGVKSYIDVHTRFLQQFVSAESEPKRL